MADKTVLLDGGRAQDIVLLEGTDPFLVRLLGSAPSRPAVPFLRTMHNAEGRQCVGVFLGDQHVGYLSDETARGVAAAIQACELDGAVARARGDLTAAWDRPGKVKLRVNLTDPQSLLCGSEPESENRPIDLLQSDSTERRGPAPGAAALLFASLDDVPDTWVPSRGARPSDSPEDSSVPMGPATTIEAASEPGLHSGWSEEYPEWPPPKPKSLTDVEPAQPTEPATLPEPLQPAPVSRPSLYSDLPPGPEPTMPGPLTTQTDPSPPPPSLQSEPAASPSPQSLLATRGAWLGATSTPAQAQGTGWLSSAGGASSGSGPSSATASPQTPAGGATPSWQDMAERTRADQSSRVDPQGEIVAAWTSSPTGPQSTPPVQPNDRPKTGRAWMLPVLAVLGVVAIAILVWKFEFAPKTYTNDTYGYSFAYPGRWDMADETDLFSGFLDEASGVSLLSMSAAAYGIGDSDQPEELAAVGVLMFTAGALGDESQLETTMQTNYSQAELAGSGVTILEPVTAVTIGGLPGYQTSLSMVAGTFSLNATLCMLVGSDSTYMLIAMATSDEWAGAQKGFDRFFDSFEPGGASG